MAFLRVLISLFLLLISRLSFAVDFKYFDDTDYLCTQDINQICQKRLTAANAQTNLSYPGTYQITSCSATAPQLVMKWQTGESQGNPTYSTGATNYIANTITKTCATGETLKLVGCTATCIPDPCMSLKDTTTDALVSCGTASCPSPSTFSYDGSTVGCSGGAKTLILPSPASSTVVNNCVATLDPNYALPTRFQVKTSASGSSTTAYCSSQYIFSGASSSGIAPPGDLASLSFGGVTPTTEDGQCPDGTVKGQLNDSYVCVADSNAGEGSGCPTGQIKDNSGNCVPFAQAGTGTGGTGTGTGTGGTGTSCPTGYIEGANGTCTTDPNYGTGGTGTGGTGTGTGTGGTGTGTGTGGTTTGTGTGTTGGSGSTDGTCTSTTCSAKTTEECKTAPDCTGDAINCAILLQSWKNACLLVAPPTTEERQDITTATTQTDGALDGIKSTYQASLDSAMSTLPSSIPTSTACIPDSSFRILSLNIPIPLSKLCPYFQAMRSMLLLVAYLFAARIIFGSIGSGGGVRV